MVHQQSAALLREARRRARLSQKELAERAGTTQSVVSAYESATRQPSLPMLSRLVGATGLRLNVRVQRPPQALSSLKGPLGARVRTRRREMKRVAAHFGLTKLRVFGSVARSEEVAGSDIDLLVDVAPGVGLLGLARCQHELQALLDNPVDLVPARDLKPGVARAVLADAVSL